jgi:hypothetical protein
MAGTRVMAPPAIGVNRRFLSGINWLFSNFAFSAHNQPNLNQITCFLCSFFTISP